MIYDSVYGVDIDYLVRYGEKRGFVKVLGARPIRYLTDHPSSSQAGFHDAQDSLKTFPQSQDNGHQHFDKCMGRISSDEVQQGLAFAELLHPTGLQYATSKARVNRETDIPIPSSKDIIDYPKIHVQDFSSTTNRTRLEFI